MPQLFGPFRQIVTLQGLSLKGRITDEQLRIVEEGGVVVENGKIVRIDKFKNFNLSDFEAHRIHSDQVLIPGLVDCHTHLIWGGNRARDYNLRTAGKTYQEILAAGGGIFDTVAKTNAASDEELLRLLLQRANGHLHAGVTTTEAKTGYGLLKEQEIRLLKLIKTAKSTTSADLIPTCLAAHVCPSEFERGEFLLYLENELLPELLVTGLARRIDIFVEEGAFPPALAKGYLQAAKKLGFELTIHADQFTTGGSELAVEFGARSADHLEASGDREVQLLAQSNVMAVALPGASLGLGMNFAPARRLLDAGAGLAIATDWNPGSAPMGDLLTQAALIGVYEKLSSAELFAAVTLRAAAALGLGDRGVLTENFKADMISFPTNHFHEIFYHQGQLKPENVWKNGQLVR